MTKRTITTCDGPGCAKELDLATVEKLRRPDLLVPSTYTVEFEDRK